MLERTQIKRRQRRLWRDPEGKGQRKEGGHEKHGDATHGIVPFVFYLLYSIEKNLVLRDSSCASHGMFRLPQPLGGLFFKKMGSVIVLSVVVLRVSFLFCCLSVWVFSVFCLS